jgi:hypothetical protein
MQVVRGSLAAGDYVVARIFGKTRLLRVNDSPRRVRGFGWHMRVRRIPINASPAVQNMLRRLEVKLGKGGYVFWLMPYYWRMPRAFAWLIGRPQLHGFTSREEAVQKAASLPDLTLEHVLVVGFSRLPRRMRPHVITLLALMGLL